MEDSTMASMLTTIDNPYNPFTQWDEWYAFDEQKGYCTCAYLGRVALNGTNLSDEDQDRANEEAIDAIIRAHGLGFYKKVHEDDEFYKEINKK